MRSPGAIIWYRLTVADAVRANAAAGARPAILFFIDERLFGYDHVGWHPTAIIDPLLLDRADSHDDSG